MQTFNSDLILTKNTIFHESIHVKGNIFCQGGMFNITALDIIAYDIYARDIDALDIASNDIIANDIDAHNINAHNIDAHNIDARDIDALDINTRDIKSFNITAHDIICESRIKKSDNAKTISRIFITGKSKLKRKEQMKVSQERSEK